MNIKGCLVIVLATLAVAGCGDDDSDRSGSNYLIAGTVLEGSYTSVARLNGYTVRNEIEVDPDGEFLGIASNLDRSDEPKTIYRIIKGGMTATPFYEFDLVDPSINRYEVSGRQVNRGDSIRFEFDNVPSDLIRPSSIVADKVLTDKKALSNLIGYYDSSTLTLRHRTGSYLDIYETSYTTDSNKSLSLSYRDNKDCRLKASITKQSYQREYADVKGQFSGDNCVYEDQYFDGLIGYDDNSNSPIIFGTTTSNSDAFVITANP